MQCPKCSAENRHDAVVCVSCGSPLSHSACPPAIEIHTSRLAIAAMVLAILSVFTCGLTAIPAVIVGIVALSVMEPKGGRVTGHGMANAAIILGLICSICAFLLMVLLKIHSPAYRMVCGTNLAGLGKAMMIYANDYEDELPMAGGIQPQWTGRTPDWKAPTRREAFGLDSDGQGGQVSISASLYLLIKYVEATPESFICRGEKGARKLIPRKHGAKGLDLIDLWDFGPEPTNHCSYSYHNPYGQYGLTTSTDPDMAVAADRNPWQTSPWARGAHQWKLFDPNGTSEQCRYGNTSSHEDEGQNVLFLDSHVEFAKRPTVGLDDDNIYTSWNAGDTKKGTPPTIGSEPASTFDSLMVNDGEGTVQNK